MFNLEFKKRLKPNKPNFREKFVQIGVKKVILEKNKSKFVVDLNEGVLGIIVWTCVW